MLWKMPLKKVLRSESPGLILNNVIFTRFSLMAWTWNTGIRRDGLLGIKSGYLIFPSLSETIG
jgi:hypothetical protein